ncbi:MAG: DUF2569 domain-containing protein [Candidatus Methylomirabilales bacterium]
MPSDPNTYRGIGGWLLVFVIGAGILSPLLFIFTAMTSYYPLFADGTWQVLTTPTSPIYHPLWKPTMLLEMVGSFAVVAFGVYAAIQLFAEKPGGPAAAIAFLLANLLLTVVDQTLVSAIPRAAVQASSIDLIRAALAAVIWIPYFKLSKRVKATYSLSEDRPEVSAS